MIGIRGLSETSHDMNLVNGSEYSFSQILHMTAWDTSCNVNVNITHFPKPDTLCCMSCNVHFLSVKQRGLKWSCVLFCLPGTHLLLIKHPGFRLRIYPPLVQSGPFAGPI